MELGSSRSSGVQRVDISVRLLSECHCSSRRSNPLAHRLCMKIRISTLLLLLFGKFDYYTACSHRQPTTVENLPCRNHLVGR